MHCTNSFIFCKKYDLQVFLFVNVQTNVQCVFLASNKHWFQKSVDGIIGSIPSPARCLDSTCSALT